MEENTIKNHDGWNNKKKELETASDERIFREREVWWCALGINIGTEQDGKNDLFERPIIILKKYNKGLITIVPITTSDKISPYHIKSKIVGVDSSVIISQIRTISTKRLLRRMGLISIKEYLTILFALIRIFLT